MLINVFIVALIRIGGFHPHFFYLCTRNHES